MFDLHGMTALVTGASGGIGSAIARALASQGARLAISGSNAQKLRAFRDELDEHTPQHLQEVDHVAIACDLSDPEQVEKLVPAAVDSLGKLDILVNNAGISPSNPLTDFDAEVYQRVMDVNLRGAVALSAAVIPHMAKRGGGAIVNVSSIAGMQGYGTISYGAAKAGMYSLARDITASHGRQGIRANVIAPGHLQTSHVEGMMSAEMRAMRRRVGPLGTEGDSWDVARAAVFLASDDARFITGTIVPVDGGVTAIGPLVGYGLLMRGD